MGEQRWWLYYACDRSCLPYTWFKTQREHLADGGLTTKYRKTWVSFHSDCLLLTITRYTTQNMIIWLPVCSVRLCRLFVANMHLHYRSAQHQHAHTHAALFASSLFVLLLWCSMCAQHYADDRFIFHAAWILYLWFLGISILFSILSFSFFFHLFSEQIMGSKSIESQCHTHSRHTPLRQHTENRMLWIIFRCDSF